MAHAVLKNKNRKQDLLVLTSIPFVGISDNRIKRESASSIHVHNTEVKYAGIITTTDEKLRKM